MFTARTLAIVTTVLGLLLLSGSGVYYYIQGQNQVTGTLVNQNQLLTAENRAIRNQLSQLREEVTVQDLDSQVQEIYDNADYLAHLEVDVTIKKGSNLRKLLEDLWRKGFFHYQDPQQPQDQDPEKPEETAAIVLCGSLFKDSEDKYYLLTAGHIRGNEYTVNKITATFKNGQTAEFELVGYDSKIDVALLKPKDENFQFGGHLAAFGHSADLKVQQTVVAMGSPMVVPNTCTRGQVVNLKIGSAYPGKVNAGFTQKQLVMHDAKIDGGNSGGPLLNLKGELVGINVMVMRNYSTWSLAVPIDDFMTVLADLKKGSQK